MTIELITFVDKVTLELTFSKSILFKEAWSQFWSKSMFYLMKICILFKYVFYLLDNVSEICVDLQDKPSSKFCFKYINCFQVDSWHPTPPLARKLIYKLNASKYVEMLHNYEKLQIISSTCMIDVIIEKSLLFFFLPMIAVMFHLIFCM